MLFVVSVLFLSGCLKNSKPELCAEIADSTIKDSCYYGVALDKKEPALCRQIQELEEKDNCLYDLAQGNFFQSKPVKKIYLKNAAVLCDKISDSIKKDYCFFKEARATGDETFCQYISGFSERESCLEELENY
ncbi:MAG: hypothetical protein HYW50_02210 [Candidatus Diapherotrites archaeon]|nr:hypothetical protein [Candidatus Diapherotrites archaeon]